MPKKVDHEIIRFEKTDDNTRTLLSFRSRGAILRRHDRKLKKDGKWKLGRWRRDGSWLHELSVGIRVLRNKMIVAEWIEVDSIESLKYQFKPIDPNYKLQRRKSLLRQG